MSTFSTAITGLKAYQTDIEVIGNNIANVNTPGFKASRTQFADLLVQSLEGATAPSGTTGGTDPLQIGSGVQVSAVFDLQTQGTIDPTGRSSDLAIQGEGFFVLSDGTRTVYTRAGTFEVDANGNLVDSATGMRVQGANGNISIPLGSSLNPTATTEATLGGNLDANAVDDLSTTQDETTVNTSFFVIDSLGAKDQVQVTFTRNASGAWNWTYEVKDVNGTSIGSGGPTSLTAFGSAGVFTTPVTGSIALSPVNGAAAPQNVAIDFSVMTGFAARSSVSMLEQDGVLQGSLISFAVGRDGAVTGVYSNGKTQSIDTLQLGSFANPSGLLRISSTQFIESSNSGVAVNGTAGTGGRGTITAGALEQSNVDLATEFVKLIIAQRGYESNARVITVADQIQQTTVNLVR